MKGFVIISVYLFLTACGNKSQGVLEQEVVKHIERQCLTEKYCSFELSEVTPFEWNKLYAFKETAQLDEIEKVIGTKYPYFTDVAKRLVFIDEKNNIVYHEDVFPNVEKIEYRQIVFDIPDSINYRSFDKKPFNVVMRPLEAGYYYVLTQ